MRSIARKAGALALAAVLFTPLVEGANNHKAEKTVSKKSSSSAKSAQSSRRARVINASLSVPSKRKGGFHRVAFAAALSGVPPMVTAGDFAGLRPNRVPLHQNSKAALRVGQPNNRGLVEKNAELSFAIRSDNNSMTLLGSG